MGSSWLWSGALHRVLLVLGASPCPGRGCAGQGGKGVREKILALRKSKKSGRADGGCSCIQSQRMAHRRDEPCSPKPPVHEVFFGDGCMAQQRARRLKLLSCVPWIL